ncbi:MAG TPA: mannitol dehydrogenase family protein [Rhizobiaceae bacterium]|nr:mannitol dehydrogenase family protein [Rhizobiaceae bacterium]
MTRLSNAAKLSAGVQASNYARSAKSGIVHIGVGAFHKAHQAVYTDLAMEDAGGDWMITGVSLRSSDVAEGLNPQNGLYTLLTRGPDGVSARVVRSIANVLVAPENPKAVLDALTAPETKIVSLTITEKGYGLDPKTGGLDKGHPAIAADIANPNTPQGAVGFIVEALRLRREKGTAPFTVLCCDNLPSNGKVLRKLVLEFAKLRDPQLADFIKKSVPFPSTMVDRITPASTDKTFADAERLTGFEDRAAVETEPFVQWIIEDDFVAGRPKWEAADAVFVRDVAPYEKMKLRLLNGAHSMLAYSGFIAGKKYVRDVMQDADHVILIERQMREVAKTLEPVPGIDLEHYARELRERFANPAIEHQTYQIAMDGTQKLPQRIIEPAVIALKRKLPLDAYVFAVAAWMRYILGMSETGEKYALRDPREAEIATLLNGANRDAGSIVDRLLDLSGLFPVELSGAPEWNTAVRQRLETMLAKSMRDAIAEEAEKCRA